MLLRRVIEHVKAQNWTAVALDFVIVVLGVFIGIQVANWNAAQSDRVGLAASLKRLDKEVSQTFGMIDKVLAHFEKGREDLNLGRDTLNACSFSTEGVAALERSLFDFVEDVQPNFVTVALDQLASQNRYQDLLSAQFQEDFGSYAGRIKEEQEQLKSHYEKLWLHHVNQHPDVSAFFSEDTVGYEGWGFKLDKPFEEICADASFRNRYINTLGFYTSINDRLVRFKAEAEEFQNSLAAELERQ